jgi:hypothetical protein
MQIDDVRPQAANTEMNSARTAAVFWPFSAIVVAMIFLQKLGLNIADSSVGVNAGLIWVGLAWFAVNGVLEVVASRLVLLTLFVAAILLSLLLNGQPLKLTAVSILILMYAGFVFRIKVSRELASRCMLFFQQCMLIIAIIVFLQQISQYTIGNKYWPNLNHILGDKLLYSGFAYIHPYKWQSPYLEPNGIFFLEPSVISAYLAMALIVELTWFRRLAHAAAFLAAMLLCLAATGPTMVILVSPFLIAKLDRRTALIVLGLAVPLVIAALATGWLTPLLSRTGELSQTNSSGYGRIMAPLQVISAQLGNASSMFTGAGPGASPRIRDVVQWPFSKLLFEYGFLTAVIFHAYLVTSVFMTPPNRILALALLLMQLFFGGGFVSHANVMPILLLCSLLMVDPSLGDPSGAPEGDMRRAGRRAQSVMTPRRLPLAAKSRALPTVSDPIA